MAKKKRNRKSVAVTSCILAALIVASSTFAWFSSQDEVTNRLTATANYGVAIAEDFTPPENLVPGQKVNKDVSAVNTGNVDALVRVHLTGALNILKENAVANETNVAQTSNTYTTIANDFSDVTDPNLTKIGLTKKDNDGNYYRTLSKVKRNNPEESTTTNNGSNDPDGAAIENSSSEVNKYSEVNSVQAGGYLAYAPGKFKFTPETAGYTYTDTNGNVVTQTTVAQLSSENIKNTWNGTSGAVGLKIDSDSFLPIDTGLYIFRRNVTEDESNGSYYEYSGYWYDAADNDQGGQGTYYALHYLVSGETAPKYKSDFVIYSTKETAETNGNSLDVTYEISDDKKSPVISVKDSTVKLFSASYERVENVPGTYTAAGSDPAKVTFDYESSDAAKHIKVVANLANIGVDSENWTELDIVSGSATTPYFYYNNDLEEGDSTAKLVDSVELDKSVKKTAYLALDFDLNVILDSVQVTYDEAGKEQITAATDSWSELGAATTVNTYNPDIEISKITWSTASL